jgi:hypothetical protein
MAQLDLGGAAEIAHRGDPGAISNVVNWTGALMSVALVAGLGVWGYKLMVRDVSGVPVVVALEGPMRVAPDDPGGLLAAHQGLAVNSIAADGGTEAPADRLILAPAPIELSSEDLPRAKLAEADTLHKEAPQTGGQGDDMAALVESLTQGVTPLSGSVDTPEPELSGLMSSEGDERIVPASVRGVSISPLPRLRPVGDLQAEAIANSVSRATSGPIAEVDPATIPVGTRLVQFGAFDSPEAARTEWVKLDGQFTDFLTDKQRVVQRALSGGKTFYRLRAMGFDDINDARRFCSAMLAERQACIPVVTR